MNMIIFKQLLVFIRSKLNNQFIDSFRINLDGQVEPTTNNTLFSRLYRTISFSSHLGHCILLFELHNDLCKTNMVLIPKNYIDLTQQKDYTHLMNISENIHSQISLDFSFCQFLLKVPLSGFLFIYSKHCVNDLTQVPSRLVPSTKVLGTLNLSMSSYDQFYCQQSSIEVIISFVLRIYPIMNNFMTKLPLLNRIQIREYYQCPTVWRIETPSAFKSSHICSSI